METHLHIGIHPQTKNNSDPRWQTPAFKVITEINESSQMRHSDATFRLKPKPSLETSKMVSELSAGFKADHNKIRQDMKKADINLHSL